MAGGAARPAARRRRRLAGLASPSRTRATCATSSGPTSPCAPCWRRYVDIVELDDEGLCCGAGGAYATVQPELAGAIRDRKRAAIERSGAKVVASANPGCALHLATVLEPLGIDVVHPIELVARALTDS